MARKTAAQSDSLTKLINGSPTLVGNPAVRKRLIMSLKTLTVSQKSRLKKLLLDEKTRFGEIDADEILKKTKLIDRTASKFKTLQTTQKRTARKETEAKERRGE